MKTITQIILGIIIIILGYLLVDSIMKPIRFNAEKDKRYDAAIKRLKAIRKAEEAYKSKYDKYTGSFDTLIRFVKTDSFQVIKSIGEIPDSLSEKEALNQGIISRDTTKVSVLDSLFPENYPIDSLRYVPYTDKKTFNLAAGAVDTDANVKVKVFKASVKNDVLLQGLDEQLIINLNKKKKDVTGFPGLKVGSLKKATNNAGNWE